MFLAQDNYLGIFMQISQKRKHMKLHNTYALKELWGLFFFVQMKETFHSFVSTL